MFFYVDTENVPSTAWTGGMQKLTAKDRIYLVYTDNSTKIAYSVLPNILSCKATIEIVSAKCGTPNALDFVLVHLLGTKCYTAPKTQHIIISKDTGYDTICEYNQRKNISVRRYKSIAEALKNS